MDEQSVVYPHNAIAFSHKKKSTDTCYNMVEPWKHSKWKKADTKNPI